LALSWEAFLGLSKAKSKAVSDTVYKGDSEERKWVKSAFGLTDIILINNCSVDTLSAGSLSIPFILLGVSSALRILAVCYCYRKKDQVIRIISARKATKTEQKQYRSFLP
jgi:uncharacterized DUF497 family protein